MEQISCFKTGDINPSPHAEQRNIQLGSFGWITSLRDLIRSVQLIFERNVGFRVLDDVGADFTTNSPAGKLMFGVVGALTKSERDLISDRTKRPIRIGSLVVRVEEDGWWI